MCFWSSETSSQKLIPGTGWELEVKYSLGTNSSRLIPRVHTKVSGYAVWAAPIQLPRGTAFWVQIPDGYLEAEVLPRASQGVSSLPGDIGKARQGRTW